MDTQYYMCILNKQLYVIKADSNSDGTEIQFEDISCFAPCTSQVSDVTRRFAVRLNEKCDGSCTKAKVKKCLSDSGMICLPKIFYPILPGFTPQPHKGTEYGDIAADISVGSYHYEMNGILKKNSKHSAHSKHSDQALIEEYLLSTSKEGGEIIRQFVEQGLSDQRCQLIAIAAPQYFDASLKGTLRFLARLAHKKVVFIGLEEICKIIVSNDTVIISEQSI